MGCQEEIYVDNTHVSEIGRRIPMNNKGWHIPRLSQATGYRIRRTNINSSDDSAIQRLTAAKPLRSKRNSLELLAIIVPIVLYIGSLQAELENLQPR